MTNDATDSRPLDLSDLRDAETLGRAWDSWLRDDIEPTRHQVSQALAAGIAATVEGLYDWDGTPAPATTFRRSLKRDLLHMHDALRAAPPANAIEPWSPSSAPGQLVVASDSSLPVPIEQPVRPKRWRLVRRWWPALEFAAAAIVILALFGITFGNARIAEFFRDDNQGNFASQGDATENPAPPSAGSEPAAANAEAQTTGNLADQNDPNAPIAIEQGWISVIRDDAGVGLRPGRMTVAEGYVAVVSDHFESGLISLTVFNATSGDRLWAANVNSGTRPGVQGRDSAPVIADGRLYFMNRFGYLYGFDIAGYPDEFGSLVTSSQLPFTATSGDLVLRDGVLYAAGGDIDEADWHLPSMVEYGGSLFIAGDADDSVVGFDVTANAVIGQASGQQLGSSAQWVSGSRDSGLWQLDPVSGTVTGVWQEPGVSVEYVSVLDNGLLAVSLSSNDGEPVGISFRRAEDFGTELYAYTPTGVLWDPRAFPAGSVAVIMTSPPETSQKLVAIDPLNPDAAVVLSWDYTNAPSKPDPAIGGSSTIVISDDDILRVYDPLTGAILGQTPIGTQNGEIAILTVVDEVIYAAFEDGTVVQFTLIQADVPVPAPQPNAVPTATLTPGQL